MTMAIKPVRVEFELRTPMVVDATLKTLDAVMAWAAVRRADFHGSLDPWAEQDATGIAAHRVGAQWCPMASALQVQWDGPAKGEHYTRRQNAADFERAWSAGLLTKRPVFDVQRGITKAGSYTQQIRWTRLITAWAMLDNQNAFEDVLGWATHIGKLWHKDFGAVATARVVEDQAACQQWANRPLPVTSPAATLAHVPAVWALSSPYWDRARHTEVLMPVLVDVLPSGENTAL